MAGGLRTCLNDSVKTKAAPQACVLVQEQYKSLTVSLSVKLFPVNFPWRLSLWRVIMTEVFFHGRGAWFIKDSDSVRLATNYYHREVVSYNDLMEPESYIETNLIEYPVIFGVFKLTKDDE